MAVVELLPAAFFICDVCGRECFVHLRNVEVDWLLTTEVAEWVREEIADTRAKAERLDLPVTGQFLAEPDHVMCQHCQAIHEVDHD